MKSVKSSPSTVDLEASEAFVQRLNGEWTPPDQAELEARLGCDRAFAEAYARAMESWDALDTHSETPDFMRYREEAMAHARHASARRWLKSSPGGRSPWRVAAAVTGVAVVLGIAWQLSPLGYASGEYRTGIGEQRMVELDDHSHIALDAASRLQVRYSKDVRIAELKEGQAQFSVAHDPERPFKVIAGDRTIIAIGTVFTVEYTDRKIHVAMMEGRVAVVPQGAFATNVSLPAPERSDPAMQLHSQTSGIIAHPATNPSVPPPPSDARENTGVIEISTGEELRVSRDGETTVTPKADLEAATAWREGKVIFRTEPLGDAIRRVNRYSRFQIEITDESLAARRISGVFEAGDSQGFIIAIERYLPVTVDRSGSDTIKLRMK